MTESARQAAKMKIKTAGIGATYRHLGGYLDVVVTRFHEPTGRVWWRQARGPGPGDSHRNLDCEDFLSVYALKRRA
jgi:hypothetical protein